MSYLYRLEDGFKFLHYGIQKKLNYFPVKNIENLKANTEVFLYIKNDRGNGIFAIGRTLADKTYKSTEIPEEERVNLLNEECIQIKVDIHTCNVIPIIEEKYLRQFPSLNDKHIDISMPLSLFTLYNAENFAWEYNFLQYRFSRIFNKGEQYYQDFFWMFGIHLLREQKIEYHWNKDLPHERKKCSECGLESKESYFLEIHDCHKINFNDNFKPVNIKDFHVLCPNCHKKRHNRMRTGTFRGKRTKEFKPIEKFYETIFKNNDFSITKTMLIRDVKNNFPSDYFDKLKELNLLLPDDKIEDLLCRYWEKTKKLDIIGINFNGEGPYEFGNAKGLCGYIDINLDIVIEAKYVYAESFSEGFAIVSHEKYGSYHPLHPFFINKTGKEFFFHDESGKTKQYTTAHSMSEGLFCVNDLAAIGEPDENSFHYIDFLGDWHMGNWGYFDSTGKEVIKPQYFTAEVFENGYAEVLKGKWDYANDRVDGEYFLIDKNGKEVLPNENNWISRMQIVKNLTSDGYYMDEKVHPDYLRASLNGKVGIKNYKEEWIVEPQFTGIDDGMTEDGLILFYDVKENLADKDDDYDEEELAAITRRNRLFGVYSITEKRILIEPKYREIESLENGHFLVEEVIGEDSDGIDETIKRILDKTGQDRTGNFSF